MAIVEESTKRSAGALSSASPGRTCQQTEARWGSSGWRPERRGSRETLQDGRKRPTKRMPQADSNAQDTRLIDRVVWRLARAVAPDFV